LYASELTVYELICKEKKKKKKLVLGLIVQLQELQVQRLAQLQEQLG